MPLGPPTPVAWLNSVSPHDGVCSFDAPASASLRTRVCRLSNPCGKIDVPTLHLAASSLGGRTRTCETGFSTLKGFLCGSNCP